MTPEEQAADDLIGRLHRAVLNRSVGIHHEIAFHGEIPTEGDVVLKADAVAWINDLLWAGGIGLSRAEHDERNR